MSRHTNFTLRQNGLFSLGTGIVLMIVALSGLAMSFSLLNQPTNKNVYAGSCSCNPPPEAGTGYTDNFCFHPPRTSGCFMTYPGGYCDPNGDGSYEDGDWVQGYNEYKSSCGSISPTSPPSDQQPTYPPATPSITSAQPISPTVTRPAGTVTPTYLPSATPITSVTPTYLPTATPTKMPTPTQLPTPTPLPELCKIIRGSKDNYKDKYDLVILPFGYTDISTFLADANEIAQNIQDTNLGTLFNKFNILAHTNLYTRYNFTYDWTMDFDLASKSMRDCHGDGFAVIIYTPKAQENIDETNKVLTLYKHIAGKSWGLGTNKNAVLRLSPNSLPHELGHSIAGLYDEYSYNIVLKVKKLNYSNCVSEHSNSEDEPCPDWKTTYPDAGCYKECTYNDAYRSTKTSIMRDSSVKQFSPIQLDFFKKALQNFK